MQAFFLIILLTFSAQVSARQLVLVQGYLSDASIWTESGITRKLQQNGWRFKGEFHYTSSGVRLFSKQKRPQHQADTDLYYQVSLPTEASIQQQAFYLGAYLKELRRLYPSERLILVGHSAGGVVARYVMVRRPDLAVGQLITIASPHLGTDSAEFGKIAGNSPLALFAPLLGADTLNRSQGLYSDLLPEMPHRFLYWLNRQPHPEAEYISIVRDRQSLDGGDFIVPEQSQYLENVFDLKYRATSFIVRGSHGLSSADGLLLLDLINERVIRKL